MTKEQLQQELKEKVKLGIKPSDLKKLKRSKSADDISQIPSPPPFPNDPPNHLLQDQLAEKQKEIESLRKKVEELTQSLHQAHQDLDHSLAARVAGIKTFGKEHDKRVKVEKELNEMVEEASEEINSADNKVSSLRKQLREAQAQIAKLQRELKLARSPTSPNQPRPESENFPVLNEAKYTLYALLAVWLLIALINSKKHERSPYTFKN